MVNFSLKCKKPTHFTTRLHITLSVALSGIGRPIRPAACERGGGAGGARSGAAEGRADEARDEVRRDAARASRSPLLHQRSEC